MDFSGISVLDNLNKTEREKLKIWTEEVLKSNNESSSKHDQLEVVVYDMKYPKKSDAIYYLLFASRKDCARKIMRDIFKKEKEVTYNGQPSLFPHADEEFEI